MNTKTLPQSLHGMDERTGSDTRRRDLLVRATTVTGGIGVLAAAYPFAASFAPSERAKAEGGPVDADISGLAPGQVMTVAWRRQPVWLMRRTDAMVRALEQPNPLLSDPLSKRSEQPADCTNATRSVRPDLFCVIGICTHLGCSPVLHVGDAAIEERLHEANGYICPCHGSVFDLAGRVIKDVPAPTNLVVPDYRFTSPTTLKIG